MEIRVLKYFLAVASEQSITKAAQSLNMTQPTLSKQLMDLEYELGKKLFIRGNRKITLTEEGIYLKNRAQEMIELLNKTENEFHKSDYVVNGDIYIGAGETEAMRIIAKVIFKLQKKYPGIHFHLFSGNADSVIEKLDKGLLDFGLLIEPTDIQKYDFLTLPFSDTIGLVMKKDSPLSNLDTIQQKDLLQIPLICPVRIFNHNDFVKWMENHLEDLNIIATYHLIYNAALLVEEGNGYALCIDNLINTTGNNNLCFKPLSPKITYSSILIWKKHQVFSKASQKFLEELKNELSIEN